MSKIRELPEGFEWKIKWEHDPDRDISWLGQWSRNQDWNAPFYVNAKTGELRVPESHEIVMVVDQDEDIFFDEDLGWLLEPSDGEYDWWLREDKGETAIYYRDSHIIQSDLPTYTGDRIDRAYWYPSDMRFTKDFKKEIEDWGMDAVIEWIIADYERHLAWVHNDWHFEYCTVTLLYNDDEINFDSLSGIESDRTEEYEREVEEDLMWQTLDLKDLEEWMLGSEEGEEREAVKVLLKLYPEIEAERKAAYEAQRAAWEAQKK